MDNEHEREYKRPDELIGVLSAMRNYLIEEDRNFHDCPKTIYCNSCEAIRLAGGDYKRYAGTDCLGDHYEITESPETCKGCRTDDYIVFYGMNLLPLKSKTPKEIINAICNGLKDRLFPCLYNPKLPEARDKWMKLPECKKAEQIEDLWRINEIIKKEKNKLKSLEELLEF